MAHHKKKEYCFLKYIAIINKTKQHIVLKATDLSVGYKSIPVCSNINIELQQGELTSIVGINGIGKSTLLRTLANFQPKVSGSIQIMGKDLNDYTALEFATTVGVVLTEQLATKNMTVYELISLGRQPYTNWLGSLSQQDKIKIKEVLDLLDLDNFKTRKCYELSDGQLQRVLIARALAQETDIILLDEPTTHLDLFHKVQLLKLLRFIAHKTEKTIVFTSHEIDMAIQLCDKILILDSQNNAFDQPCKLIENNAFNGMFPSDTVTFDNTTGTFRIHK